MAGCQLKTEGPSSKQRRFRELSQRRQAAVDDIGTIGVEGGVWAPQLQGKSDDQGGNAAMPLFASPQRGLKRVRLPDREVVVRGDSS